MLRASLLGSARAGGMLAAPAQARPVVELSVQTAARWPCGGGTTAAAPLPASQKVPRCPRRMARRQGRGGCAAHRQLL
ncbi:hypothetical protein FZ025_21140 [Xanthomonas hyacinthi]|uniref:Uncharacterized protein n=1 Tax=Xanthomonas hyacinthi TaxID=56455 RepID=A0A2S7EYW9_9XANT|nr:hypothetical protein XhyaCFBP1156_06460 [Xanthomonas hyacinthi]QGY78990.1 hypothetical protein FZ025_21140 [Xanthomonas hyacinthi]